MNELERLEWISYCEYPTYEEFKADMDATMKQTAENFVKIGYLLLIARDTGILGDTGYTSMRDFAKAEYGLNESQTSRFIAIAEKYGKDGQLRVEFEGYGQSKLSEMLTLPDAVAEALPKELTREEIREIKAEVKAEEAVTPLEVFAEAEETEDGILVRFFRAWMDDTANAQAVCAVYDGLKFIRTSIREPMWDESVKDLILDHLAPNGYAVLGARIKGIGSMMLSIKGDKEEPELVNIRENTKEKTPFEAIGEALDAILGPYDVSAEERYRQLTGKDVPEPKAEPEKEEPKKPETSKKPERDEKQKKKKPEKSVKIARAQEKKPENTGSPTVQDEVAEAIKAWGKEKGIDTSELAEAVRGILEKRLEGGRK